VGTTKNALEALYLNPRRIVSVIEAGDSLVGVDERSRVLRWNDAARQWQEALTGHVESGPRPFGFSSPILGPIYDAAHDRILAIKLPWAAGFRFTSIEATLLFEKGAGDPSAVVGVAPPLGAVAIFVDPHGRIVLLTRRTVYRVEGDLAVKRRELKWFGATIPLGAAVNPYVAVGPDPPLSLAGVVAAAMNPDTGAIAVWSNGELVILEPTPNGMYRQAAQERWPDKRMAATVAFSGSTIVLALADGHVWIVDATTLEVRHDLQPEGRNRPRWAEAAPGGRWFAVGFHNRRIWLWDAQRDGPAELRIAGNGDISSGAFSDRDHLIVIDRTARATEYALEPFAIVAQRAPSMPTMEWIYRYLVVPLYTVFPKPGELDNVVSYVLTEQESAPMTNEREDLRAPHIQLNIYGPIWSSLAFVAAVLALTCLYIHRSDF
jgi:hypothetical protein